VHYWNLFFSEPHVNLIKIHVLVFSFRNDLKRILFMSILKYNTKNG
jgi:hypothetical protein